MIGARVYIVVCCNDDNLTRKTGMEPIYDDKGKHISSVLEFWQWAYSDIIGNIERGHFAEYLVARALDAAKDTRGEWDKYDVLTNDDISIEVKSSGYVQTWQQKGKSKISFSIRPTRAFNSKTNAYEREIKRQAQIYVFCVHNYEKKDEGLNPLDMKQWDFYILPTEKLNMEVKEQKTISLQKIIKLGAEKCSYSELSASINKLKCLWDI